MGAEMCVRQQAPGVQSCPRPVRPRGRYGCDFFHIKAINSVEYAGNQ